MPESRDGREGTICTRDRHPRSHYQRIDFATTAFSTGSRNVALMASAACKVINHYPRGKRINNSAISLLLVSFRPSYVRN